MTIEERRLVKVSKKWLTLHPEFRQNLTNATAMTDVIQLNDLDWTVAALEVAYTILKLQKFKFSKEKK